MTHYEARLEHDLERIREELAKIATQVQDALKNAVHALLMGSREQAYAVVLGDLPINRAIRALDKACYGFIAIHLPSAGHLRRISATMRIGIALERIGDYAVTVCREAVRLPRAPDGILAREIELMARESGQMLEQAMQSFADQDAAAAKATMVMAEQVERTFDTVFEEVIGDGEVWSRRDIFALLVILHMIERVSDQAKNICEEAVFAAIGETKAPKTYQVLFLDEDNAGRGKLAEALGTKAYPTGVQFASAGREPTEVFDVGMSALAAKRGLELAGDAPVTLEPIQSELEDYHVIISLSGPVTDYLGLVPFHTVALEWEVGQTPPADAPDAADRWEAIYRELSLQLRDLVEILHGHGEQ